MKPQLLIFSSIFTLIFTFSPVFSLSVQALSLDVKGLEHAFKQLSSGFDGRVGVCAQDLQQHRACYQGQQRFSLQSVMKLLVAMAVFDAVDRKQLSLNQLIKIQTQDLSLYVQPIAKLVGPQGYQTTVLDLTSRAVIDSDSAATDILIARLGGPAAVQAVLKRKGFANIRFDRDERHLQTEILGLSWKPEYVDSKRLDQAIQAQSAAKREAAWQRYLKDPRDTATPQDITALLSKLAAGQLLSPASTQQLLEIMARTVTFPDRLKAGLAPGWRLGHKTGTSGSWQGLTAATNDVGVLTAPDGSQIAISVLIGDSRAAAPVRAALMAKLTAATINYYRP